MPPARSRTSSRKKQLGDRVLGTDVRFRVKTPGLERLEFVHNALPEIDLNDVSTGTTFLGKTVSMPLIVSSMTGGYAEALTINRGLAVVCESLQIPMGVGSQRQVMENDTFRRTFRLSARPLRPSP